MTEVGWSIVGLGTRKASDVAELGGVKTERGSRGRGFGLRDCSLAGVVVVFIERQC